MVRPDAAPRSGLRAAPPSGPARGRRPRAPTRRSAPARPSASSWGGVGTRGSTRPAALGARAAGEDALAGREHGPHVGWPFGCGGAPGNLARRPGCRRVFTVAFGKPPDLSRKGFRGRGAANPEMVTGNEPRVQALSRPLSFVGFAVFAGQKGTFYVAHPPFPPLLSLAHSFMTSCCFL